MSQRRFHRCFLLTNLLILSSYLGVPPSYAANQYILSSSFGGNTSILVDDALDVYLNDVSIYSDGNASSGNRSPITFSANVGDILRIEVRDTYGVCASLSPLYIADSIGRSKQIDPGFSLGCGRPNIDLGLVYNVSIAIPILPDLPLSKDVGLKGSAFAGVVPGPDGRLYGVTYSGDTPATDFGTIYAVDRGLNTVTTLHVFNHTTDGSVPYDDLIFDPDTGKFYGTTFHGGPSNDGTIFEFDPVTNNLHTIRSDFFGYRSPKGPLVKFGGYLFGTLTYDNGAIFRMAPDGSDLTILHPFSDFSALPQQVTLGEDGFLYGVTIYGGVHCNPSNLNYGCGTIFKLRPVLPGDSDIQFSSIYEFQSATLYANANYPQGSISYGSDGMLYGTNFYRIFRLNTDGTGFQ